MGPSPRPLAERLREASNSDEWPELDFGEVVSPDLLREAADALDAYERLAEAARLAVRAHPASDPHPDDQQADERAYCHLAHTIAALDDLRRSQKETR